MAIELQRRKEPLHPDAPETEWHCPLPECPVEEVVVRCSYIGKKRQEEPPIICPLCGVEMKFIAHLVPVEVDDEEGPTIISE